MDESNILNAESGSYKTVYEKVIIEKVRRKLYLFTKRIFDILISIVLLLFFSPLLILISIFIKAEDKGSAFIVQERIGKDGKIFKFYKFRSMVSNADDVLKEMLKDSKLKREYKKNMKFKNDPRITKVGKFIRKTSIDELPQLLNVLKGDMSLIGNRPYLPREKEDMEEYYEDIVSSKPGITGYWQVNGRSSVSFEDRLKLESFYSKNMDLLLDIKIFFLTFYVVFFGRGAE